MATLSAVDVIESDIMHPTNFHMISAITVHFFELMISFICCFPVYRLCKFMGNSIQSETNQTCIQYSWQIKRTAKSRIEYSTNSLFGKHICAKAEHIQIETNIYNCIQIERTAAHGTRCKKERKHFDGRLKCKKNTFSNCMQIFTTRKSLDRVVQYSLRADKITPIVIAGLQCDFHTRNKYSKLKIFIDKII